MFGSIISYRIPTPAYGWKFWERLTNYSWLQNTFTGKPETHTAIYIGDLHRLSKQMVFEASVDVHYNSWDYNSETQTVFQIGATERELKQILEQLTNEYNGKLYGFAQILYFIPRWAIGWFIDVRKWWFPFRDGMICSELVWQYLYKIAKQQRWNDLREYLEEWNPDNVHSGDIRQILDRFSGVYFNKIKGI